jgi:hypothetical protein
VFPILENVTNMTSKDIAWFAKTMAIAVVLPPIIDVVFIASQFALKEAQAASRKKSGGHESTTRSASAPMEPML